LSYEVELFALAVLLYLYDSTVLLYANEAILSCDRRSNWRVSTGWQGFLVAGRTICLLNPFTLYRPCVRLRWNLYAPDLPGADESWSREIPKLGAGTPWAVSAAIALFLLLPIGLFTPLGTYAILPAVCVLYGSILVALVFIRAHSARPGLTGLRFAGLTFECLACPPFGVNLVRRVALMCPVRESLLPASARLLPASEWDALRAHCMATLDRELWRLEASSAERQSLEKQRARLSEWMQQR
jgi:hypothetical protein